LLAARFEYNEQKLNWTTSAQEKMSKNMSAQISYRVDVVPTAEQVIELYNDAGLPRPTHDPQRIRIMFENSDLIVTAWEGSKLAGVARTITDWVWCSY
jgi:hypothetical protein